MMWQRFRNILIVLITLTGVLLLTAMVLRYSAPALSVQAWLYQARYGLLVWRLCLYTTAIVLWCNVYQRAGPDLQRRHRRVIVWFVVLVVFSETSNLLQWRGGEV